MKVGVLSEFCLARSHGSGAQMLRILDAANLDHFHVYWSSRPFGPSVDPKRSFLFENPLFWRPLRLNRLMQRLHDAVGLWAWRGQSLNARLFDRVRPAYTRDADVLYVFATSEESARCALALVNHLRKPFVVHIMDLQHEDGLDPATMPGYGELLCRASAVLAINEAIAREVRKFPVRAVEIVPFCQTLYDLPPRPAVVEAGPCRVTIIGAIHHRGLDLLAEAWPHVLRRVPRAELAYAGRQLDAFPGALRPFVQDLGFVEGERYLQTLRESHVGYVPGPVELGCYGKFSIPSRIADFCMAGLPVVACVAPDSATELFFRPVRGTFVQVPTGAAELVDQLVAWLADEPTRVAAGDGARRFAEAHLSSARVAARVAARLREAGQPPTLSPAPGQSAPLLATTVSG